MEDSLLEYEVAFRALPEYELRAADVAYVSRDRCQQADREDYIRGAPDIVIEILSPSNAAGEMYEKENICLENGAQEFWVIDPDRLRVRVATAQGKTATWREGQEIPLPLFGSEARVKVDDIFLH